MGGDRSHPGCPQHEQRCVLGGCNLDQGGAAMSLYGQRFHPFLGQGDEVGDFQPLVQLLKTGRCCRSMTSGVVNYLISVDNN